MKQLKIIANNNNVNTTSGVINVNFNQTIDVPSYSSMALDKISMTILPDPSGVLTIQTDQSINVTTQITGTTATATRVVTLPAGIYSYGTGPTNTNTPTYPDLMLTLTSLFNAILDGDPQLSAGAAYPQLDLGLGFLWYGTLSDKNSFTANLDIYQTVLDTSGTTNSPPYLTNGTTLIPSTTVSVAASVINGYVANTVGTFFVNTSSQLITGCMQVSCILEANDFNTGPAGSGFAIGIGTPNIGAAPTILYGVQFLDNTIRVFNNGVAVGAPLNNSNFVSGSTVSLYMYTDSSTGNLRLATKIGASTWYVLPAGSFTGYNFNTAYCFGCLGESSTTTIGSSNKFLNWEATLQPNLSTDSLGSFYVSPQNKLYLGLNSPSLGATNPDRIVNIDFTSSQSLITSLGFATNVLQAPVSATATANFPGTNPLDFTSYYDLALDVLNLSLESYVGTSGDASNSAGITGKRNTLAYFLIQRLTETQNVFFAEAKQLMFLSIDNKQPISISTLQFRLYNISTNQPVNFSNASFNVYVADKGDDGTHDRDYMGNRSLGIAHDVAQF